MSEKRSVRTLGWVRRQLPTALVMALGVFLGAIAFGGGRPSSPPHTESSADSTQPKPAPTVWTCAMHPQIRQPEPGQCPICGMDLIPAGSSEGAGASIDRIQLSERAKMLAKLRVSPVRRRGDAAGEIRLLGRVEPNESSLKTVTAWTGGRIDRLHVNVTGTRVKAGQAIATLYSPEIFNAHQDLIVAQRQVQRMTSGVESARRAAQAAFEATRERLRLLGVPDGTLARMENQERPTRAVTIYTPFSGTVIERIATEGAYVMTGAPLYRIANLKSLWVQLDAYESDLPRLALKQPVRVEVEAFPGLEFEGVVTFIDPTLDPRKRTARVRVEVENSDGQLRPGMFAQAVVAEAAAEGEEPPLVIPSSAPLFTGSRSIVYVEVASGDGAAYEPRTVRLGPRLGSYYPVVAGLEEGERVVTRGAFSLDADLQIRGGASMMSSADDRDREAVGKPIALPQGELSTLAPTVDAYLAMQRALAADDLGAAQRAAQELQAALAKAQLSSVAAKAAWAEVQRELASHAAHVGGAKSLEHARMGFEALSAAVAHLLSRFGNPTNESLVQAHCPMAFGSRGALWVQGSGELDNAYFGESMRDCGEVKHTVEPGRLLDSDSGETSNGVATQRTKATKATKAPQKSKPKKASTKPAAAPAPMSGHEHHH